MMPSDTTRATLIEAMAQAIWDNRYPEYPWVSDSRWSAEFRDDSTAALDALLAALPGLGLRVVPVEHLRQLESDRVWTCYHAGIERNGMWIDGAMSDAVWLQRELGLKPLRHDASKIRSMLPALVERLVAAAPDVLGVADE